MRRRICRFSDCARLCEVFDAKMRACPCGERLFLLYYRKNIRSAAVPQAVKGSVLMEEQKKEAVKGRDLYEWVQALVSSVVVVVLIFTFGIRIMGVDGHSMLNTLQHNDRLAVLNAALCGDYEYGDIVILRKNGVFNNDPIVKRVIAVGGQTVDIDFANGIVYVDGEVLEEDYIREPTYTAEGTEFPLTVPEGSIFVMGDNRNGSNDSRDYRLGTVDTRYVIGKAVFLIFPGPDAVTEKRDYSRIGVIGA